MRARIIICLASLLVLRAGPAFSSTIHVPSDQPAIQAGIDVRLPGISRSNDAFIGVKGARAPYAGKMVVLANAYDAGSEANSEDCGFIPGPPCGNGESRAPGGAEGFVHIHSGIHGSGDLDPAEYDWRNPVARITMRSMN